MTIREDLSRYIRTLLAAGLDRKTANKIALNLFIQAVPPSQRDRTISLIEDPNDEFGERQAASDIEDALGDDIYLSFSDDEWERLKESD